MSRKNMLQELEGNQDILRWKQLSKFVMSRPTLKEWPKATVRWLRCLEHHPMHQKIPGLIPSLSPYPGCRFKPGPGQAMYRKETTDQCFSLTLMFLSMSVFLSLSFSLSSLSPASFLSKINKQICRGEFKK